MHQPGEAHKEVAGSEPTRRTGLLYRQGVPAAIALVGLVGVFLMTAVLAAGTAAPPAPTTNHGGVAGVPARATTTIPPSTTVPATSTTSAASPSTRSSAPARRAVATPTSPPSTSTTAAPAPAAASGGNGTNCGGQPTESVDGQQWSCTFDDEFNGTALDLSKWIVQQTADSAYHSGIECYEDTPSNVNVSGGTLNLTVEKVPSSFVCPAVPPYPTQYTSGMASTYQRFNQAYGLFEVRAKVSDATAQGLQSSFWLYPAHLTYGPWPVSGEIDIAELFSQYPTLAIPTVHYNNSWTDPESTNDNCVIGDPSAFHTYAVEWTPQSMAFIYDGNTCLVDRWNAAWPLVDPEPFNQPFFICLTQALGIGSNSFIPGTTPLPATTSVDWVRVWGIPPSPG